MMCKRCAEIYIATCLFFFIIKNLISGPEKEEPCLHNSVPT